MTAHTHLPVIVISLARSVERRDVMAGRLEVLGLPYSFFDAVNGGVLDLDALPAYNGRLRRLIAGRDLTHGEMGCLLSHRAVMQKMVDEDIARALILEDDALLADDLPTVLSLLAEKKWDIVRFLARKKTARESETVAALNDTYNLTRVFGTPGGAYGYLLTREAAARLLPFMQRNWQPNDTLLGQTWRHGLDVYGVLPSPVVADDDIPSTIGDERFRKSKESLTGWERIAHVFVRGGFKVWENIGKQRVWRRYF